MFFKDRCNNSKNIASVLFKCVIPELMKFIIFHRSMMKTLGEVCMDLKYKIEVLGNEG